MASKICPNQFLKIIAGSTIFGTALLCSATPTKAAECSPSGTVSSLSSNCTITPDQHFITVYEMGLCTGDPLSGTNFVATTCTATLTTGTGGISVNIASTTTDLTGGTAIRPSSGTYEYAYIKMSNTFGVKGEYKLGSTTYYSSSTGGSDGSSATYFESSLHDFDGGRTCTGSPTYTDTGTLSNGVYKARIATTAYVTASACDASSSTSARVVGSFKFNTPITISDEHSILQVSLKSNGTGMTVIPDTTDGTTVDSFDSGPFQPEFEVF